jgi:hypothetical protein
MREGDVVTVKNREGEWLVVDVEKEHDPSLGTTCDMGRYTIMDHSGSQVFNSPGYLMTFLRKYETESDA